jgi:transcriptional antiterminator NusG
MAGVIYAVRTTANREDQVVDYLVSKADAGKAEGVYAIVRPHGMRGYIFIEAENEMVAQDCVARVPYARGILGRPVPFNEIEHMLEQVKVERNIQKGDIVEILSGAFKRDNAKVVRINEVKDEVVVELLEAAVPIPITLNMDAVKVIRRDEE